MNGWTRIIFWHDDKNLKMEITQLMMLLPDTIEILVFSGIWNRYEFFHGKIHADEKIFYKNSLISMYK